MSKHAFELSLIEGRHNELAKLAGEWEGTTRVWFEPDKLGDEAPIHGAIRSALGGRCLVHEYQTLFMGEQEQGIALYTWHIDRQCYECAWIDSSHTGTQIMYSEGTRGQDRFSVLGSYGGHDGDPVWGWRTEMTLVDEDHLIITAFNISPEGDEAKAVEIVYARKN
jgi:hypothetical protein